VLSYVSELLLGEIMASAYEMQLIGQFLVTCGYHARDREESSQTSMNAFQQTPLDAALGDILGGVDARFFMVEFKAEGRGGEETKKGLRAHMRDRLKIAHNFEYKDTTYNRLSHRCHVYGEGSMRSGARPDCKFSPYIFTTLKSPAVSDKDTLTYETIDSFILDGMYNSIGLPIEEFEAYLAYLYDGYGDENTETGDTLMYVFSELNGVIEWTCRDTLKDVFLNLRVPGKSISRRPKP
jgi:hypothetical protein